MTTKPYQVIAAWAVHVFTAMAACAGLMTLVCIYQHEYVPALWYMAISVVIDALDGSFARLMKVKVILPQMDGALLDNMVDYINYVITPCFFLYVKPNMLPESFLLIVIMAVVMTSAYQFCQVDAKTPDHFFKGFPCYWNIVLFYMFIFETSAALNMTILLSLCILIFVPIKYVYPSRLDYLTESYALKWCMHLCSITYGISTAFLLAQYPHTNTLCLILSMSYIALYLGLSVYRTCSPMIKSRIALHQARQAVSLEVDEVHE